MVEVVTDLTAVSATLVGAVQDVKMVNLIC